MAMPKNIRVFAADKDHIPTRCSFEEMAAAFVLFQVTVPARVLVKAARVVPAQRTGAGVTSSKRENNVVSFASTVRDFIVNDDQCEWISEDPFLNGKAWWVSFEFSCKSGYAEKCTVKLKQIGVGDEEDGRGMIHVLPLNVRHIASRPKECGRPLSLPYSAPGLSTETSPQGPILKKNSLVVPMGESEADEMKMDAAKSIDTATTGVTFIDEEYDDGAELENEQERLQAKLIAEVEASEQKKDTLHKYTENFAETVTSRVAVDALVQFVTAASEFSFDYLMLVILAAIIACVGLVTNNSVVIVASMLVSPLMGPILATTLGSVLSDRELVKRGFFSELVGLFLCLMVGFVGGLCAAPVNGTTWPTQEMASRAVVSALYIGVAIAIPSGMGAALSVTGNNTSSLVGVAISASLLPPAVNAGILCAASSLKSTGLVTNPNVDLDDYLYDGHVTGALISFGVTTVNIICIYISAYIMFEVKEVRGANTFWKEDVRNVRMYNEAVREDSGVAAIYEKALSTALRKASWTTLSSSGGRKTRTSPSTFFTPIEKLNVLQSRKKGT